jgi:glycolate oxidase FAD binding subunit
MNRESSIELVSGLHAGRIQRVTSVGEVSELLRAAGEANETVVPFGGRRSLATGSVNVTATYGLDLGAMSGVLAYEPADLTVSVRAGTTWAEIQRVLGEQGQELPLDIPEPETTTVGGVVATGFAGARRLRSGSLKDLLIGCEFVRGDGLAAKAGGMVVKNVSGFEIPRFLHGSWGALAIVTSVNLKVVPKPRADGTLISTGYGWSEAIDLARSLIAGDSSLEAVSVEIEGGQARIAVRATGRSRAVASTLETARKSLGGRENLATLDGDDSVAHWQELVDRYSESDERLVVAVACRPQDVSKVAGQLINAAPQATMCVMPGYGSIRVRLETGDDRANTDALRPLIDAASSTGASYVIESAPVGVRGEFGAWGQEPDGIAVMRAVKAQFDPNGVLNPGRLVV